MPEPVSEALFFWPHSSIVSEQALAGTGVAALKEIKKKARQTIAITPMKLIRIIVLLVMDSLFL